MAFSTSVVEPSEMNIQYYGKIPQFTSLPDLIRFEESRWLHESP